MKFQYNRATSKYFNQTTWQIRNTNNAFVLPFAELLDIFLETHLIIEEIIRIVFDWVFFGSKEKLVLFKSPVDTQHKAFTLDLSIFLVGS